MSNFIQQNIFLIDGIGALVSAFFLGFILVRFNELVGMPVQVLYFLSIIPIFFAVYSLSRYFIKPTAWRKQLKAIAIANLLYCFVTSFCILMHYQELAPLGFVYFISEIVIILILVNIEWKISNHN